jgi:thioredoxin-like negative regulator of GroEL
VRRRLAPILLGTALLTAACAPAGRAEPAAPTGTPGGATAGTSHVADPLPGYEPDADAEADIQAALAAARSGHREVLVDFGADWCPDCRVLHKLLEDPQVRPVLDRGYRVVAVDVGEFDRNLDVAGRYVNLKTSGIPALVVLAPDGSVRVATSDGSFANARDMSAAQVRQFLVRWAPAGSA